MILEVLIQAGKTVLLGMISLLPNADTFLFSLPSGFDFGTGVVESAFLFVGWLNYLLPVEALVRVTATMFIISNAWGLLWVIGWIYGKIPGKLT